MGDLVWVGTYGIVVQIRFEKWMLSGCIWGHTSCSSQLLQAGSVYDKERSCHSEYWLQLFNTLHPISTLGCIHSLFIRVFPNIYFFWRHEGRRFKYSPLLWFRMDFGDSKLSVSERGSTSGIREGIHQSEEFPWLETEPFLPRANIRQRRRPRLQIASHAQKYLWPVPEDF